MATHLQLRQRASRRLDQALVAVNKGAGAVDDIPRTGVFWTRQEVTDWLNEAHLALWGEIAEVEPKSLRTEIAGAYTAGARAVSLQAILGTTDDPLKILEVRDVTGVTTGEGALIPFAEHTEFDVRRTAWESSTVRSQVSGRAWSYGGASPMQIELFPTPAAGLTLRIRYVRAEPLNPTSGTAPALRADTADNATGDADVPIGIPSSQHELLTLFTVVQAKQKEETDFRPEWTLYQEKLARFIEAVEERQQQDGRRTRQLDISEYDMGHGRRVFAGLF